MKLYFHKGIGPYRKGQTKLGRFYVKSGIAQQVYQTKVLVADVPVQVNEQPAVDVEAPATEPDADVVDTTDEPDEYDNLDVEQLRAIAQLKGVKVHHNAGVEKIKKALRGA